MDHTLLKADATQADIRRVCAEALEHQFAAVCVNSFFVPFIAAELSGSRVNACTVIGFPLGAASTEAKAAESRIAVRSGARELDMVVQVGALLAADLSTVEDDIASVVKVAHDSGAIVKVILENGYLTARQIAVGCKLAQAAGADFVKTSTGFGPSGATTGDVALMRRTVGDEMGVKAAGGIRSLEDALQMVEAGANRIGSSASVRIVEAIA
jgi:deoxyribose-phosphate aldolase